MGNILNKVPEKGTETNLFVLGDEGDYKLPLVGMMKKNLINQKKVNTWTIRVRFRNEEDLREFEKIDQTNITTKTKAFGIHLWRKIVGTVLKWVEDESV